MLKKVLLGIAISVGATLAHAQVSTPVRVGTKLYYTGYLGRSAELLKGATYEQFGSKFLAELPDNYDSRTDTLLGACNLPIRDQGSCGSCWAFSRTAALECAKIRAGKATIVDLSEQDTVSNDRNSSGCNGGYMGFPYEKSHGLVLESKCPYTARNGSCNSTPVDTQAISWNYIGNNGNPTVDEMRAAIYKYGYVSVTTAAGGSGYDTGADGVFKSCGSRGINHMTDLVAYRKIANGSFQFLMRNSWGTSWGTDGFGWMPLGCNQTGTGSESAAVVIVDGPGPTPAIKLHAPIEVMTAKSVEVYLSTTPEQDVSYTWTYGNVTKTGAAIWVALDTTTPIMLTGTNKTGAKVSTTVTVNVE